MKNVISFLLFFLLSKASLAQSPELGVKAPSTPNANSLGKYVEVPVNTYTGVPKIDIPLVNLQTQKLNMDFSLSYHASGLRVGEEASSVGLGWTLNSGGAITRIVRGETDSKTREPIRSFDDFTWNYAQNTSSTKAYDNQPDLYYYNFDGMTGKFFISDNGDVVCNDNNNLKITLISNSANDIVQFKVTSSKGITYLFGEDGNVDYSLNQPFLMNEDVGVYEPGTIGSYPSAYFLTKVRSVDNLDSIQLEYEKENSTYYTNENRRQDYTTSGQSWGVAPWSYSRIWLNGRRIKTVSSPNWKVEFQYLLNREDLNAYNNDIPKALSQMIISDYQNKVKKRIKFYMSYFISNGIGSVGEEEKYKYKRLKLDSLQFFSGDLSDKLPPYSFKYDDVTLPHKNSTAQDYWGFYNGKTGNPISMLPNIQDFYFLPISANDPVIIDINGGSNRGPDANYMKACSLNEIKFPTGGTHRYYLEPNIYSKEVHSFDDVNNVVNTGIIGYETSETIFHNTSSIEIPANKELVDILIEYGRANSYTSGYGIIDFNGSWNKTINLDDENVKYYSEHLPVSLIHSGVNTIDVTAFHGRTTVTLVLRSRNVSYNNSMAAGLRVKQVKITEDSKTVVNNYSYQLHDPNTFQLTPTSSGILVTEPLFISTYMKKVSETQRTQLLTVSPYPLIELGTTQGGFVGYSEVEIAENNGENGSKIFYYSIKDLPDIKIAQYGGFNATTQTLELQDPDHHEYYRLTNGQKMREPFTPLASRDYKRGLLEKVINLSDLKIPVSKEEYFYGFNTDTISGVKFIKRYDFVYEVGMWIYKMIRIDFNIYKEIFGNPNVFKKIETEYAANNTPIVKEFNFLHSKDPILLKESTEIHGQKNIKTIYKYVSDYGNTENFNVLKSKNLPALPIKIEKTVNGNQVEGNVITYNDFGYPTNQYRYFSSLLQPPAAHNPNSLLPSGYSKLFTSQLDQSNNVIQQHKEHDSKTSFLWDYNTSYLISEVRNASQSDIAYTSFEAEGKGNWTYSGTPTTDMTTPTGKRSFVIVNSANNITKTGLSASTTYIVSYWKKSGTVSVNGTTPVTGNTINGWTYYEHKVVNPAGGTVTVSGTSGVIDELRLYPSAAQMATYTYDPLIGMTSQCDGNNKVTYYEYDSFGRLSLVRDQDKNIIKKICYNYAGQEESCLTYSNQEQTRYILKDDCPDCQIPSGVTYTVPANSYFASSTTAANTLAQNEIDANGQAYANANGTCTASVMTNINGYNGISGKRFTLLLHNNCTGANYYIYLDPGVSGVNLNPQIPTGNYNVTITPDGGSGPYSYSFASFYQYANTASFLGIDITTTKRYLAIQP